MIARIEIFRFQGGGEREDGGDDIAILCMTTSELVERIAALQRRLSGVPKSEKKKRRSLQDEMISLQRELETKDAMADVGEADLLASLIAPDPPPPNVASVGRTPPGTPPRADGRRSRQKERMARKAQEIERIEQEARLEARDMPNERKMEEDALGEKVRRAGYAVYDIPPDGHCLFAAIADAVLAIPRIKQPITVKDYRRIATSYMRVHSEDFRPFIEDPDLEAYLTELETTAAWGGQLEMLAIAKSLDLRIDIWQAVGDPISIHESGKDRIRLAFYKKFYALGEHYNSLRRIASPGTSFIAYGKWCYSHKMLV